MRSKREVDLVLSLVADGHPDTVIAQMTDVPRSTIRDWRAGRIPGAMGSRARGRRPCPICAPGTIELPPADYAYLLGLYLGDGCISRTGRTYCLRFFLDASYPGIVVGCRDALETIRPNQRAWARLSKSSRCYVVAMYSNHWPCLFPQHGAGRKHERRIALHDWQEEIVSPPRRHFVRGLIHSDGCRIVANDPGPEKRSIPLPNKSEDIKALYRDSLDALGVHWTQPCGSQVAVYQKSSVAILEEFIGPKR